MTPKLAVVSRPVALVASRSAWKSATVRHDCSASFMIAPSATVSSSSRLYDAEFMIAKPAPLMPAQISSPAASPWLTTPR